MDGVKIPCVEYNMGERYLVNCYNMPEELQGDPKFREEKKLSVRCLRGEN